MEAPQKTLDEYLSEKPEPQPEVYTIGPKLLMRKDGQLSEEQVKHFFEKGFVIVKDFFDKNELEEVKTAVDKLVDEMADILYNAGKIKNKHEDKGFNDRLIYLEKEFPGTSVVMHKRGNLAPEFKKLWSNEKLLNVIEQFIGPDIAGHPVWNLRTKIPNNEQVTVPWHQDNGYLAPCAVEVLQPTAWIPLVDANMTNGCMQVVSGGHRKGVTATHTCCSGDTWYVDLSEEAMRKELGADLANDIVTCEVPFGGVLFLNNAIPHRSLQNRSQIIRWSLDLRWQVPDKDNGFYGLKKNFVMRKKDDPKYRINWDDAPSYGETKTYVKKELKDPNALVPVICGPWMRRWEITHQNRHTAALVTNEGKLLWHAA